MVSLTCMAIIQYESERMIMQKCRLKNPLEFKRKHRVSLLKLKLDRYRFGRLLQKELMKQNEERDAVLLDELYQTIDFLTDYIAVVEQNSRKTSGAFLKRGLAYACIVIAILFSASAVAQIAGFRIWTAVIKGDPRYLSRNYNPSVHAVTEKTAFSSLDEVYNRIDAELYLPEKLNGIAAANITVSPSDLFSDDETRELHLSLDYKKDDKYMNVDVYMTDSDDSAAITQDTDIRNHITKNGDILSVDFVYQNRLYRVSTNMDFATLCDLLFQIIQPERLELLG